MKNILTFIATIVALSPVLTAAPKQSRYTISISGINNAESQPDIVFEDGQDVTLQSIVAIPTTATRETSPGVLETAITNVAVGRSINLRRDKFGVTHYRVSSSYVEGWVSIGLVRYPVISRHTVEGEFAGDQCTAVLPASKSAVSRRFLFLKWRSTMVQQAETFEIQREDAQTL